MPIGPFLVDNGVHGALTRARSSEWIRVRGEPLEGSAIFDKMGRETSNPGLDSREKKVISCLRDMASYKGRMVDALAMRGEEGRGQLR